MTDHSLMSFNLNEEIQRARSLLMEDMVIHDAFDPSGRYEAKNDYFSRANEFGLFLMRSGLSWGSEIYYREMLNTILSFRADRKKNFNKGIVYANLGISEAREGKFEIGIAHLLTAEQEDRPIAPDFEILNTPLWQQFEEPYIFQYLRQFNSNTVTFIDDTFLKNFVTNLATQDRIFLEGTLLTLRQNRSLMNETPNSYSLGRLYSSLKDICLLTESLLRKQLILQGVFQATEMVLLPRLLETAVGVQIFERNAAKDSTSANNLGAFLEKLETLASTTPIERSWLYYLVLVRNFTGHHFDISDRARTLNGRAFFPDLFDIALQNVILALLHLKRINAL